jgi:rfaE bifunctional protein nucleotidyltransferase chain/domain
VIELSLPHDLVPSVRDDRVALCHGCFDVLHFGHINHLEAAATLADRLVVSITADPYVGKPGRPVFSADERARVLRALSCVDHVVVVAAPDALPVISALRPDVFVKGSDYRSPQRDHRRAVQFRAERDLVMSYGGAVDYTSEAAFSSTGVLDRLVGSPRHAG